MRITIMIDEDSNNDTDNKHDSNNDTNMVHIQTHINTRMHMIGHPANPRRPFGRRDHCSSRAFRLPSHSGGEPRTRLALWQTLLVTLAGGVKYGGF
jgi:hypothetical protein